MARPSPSGGVLQAYYKRGVAEGTDAPMHVPTSLDTNGLGIASTPVRIEQVEIRMVGESPPLGHIAQHPCHPLHRVEAR